MAHLEPLQNGLSYRGTSVHNCLCPLCGNRWTMESNLNMKKVTEFEDGYGVIWKVIGCLEKRDGYLVNKHNMDEVVYAYNEFKQGRGPIWGKPLEIVRA